MARSLPAHVHPRRRHRLVSFCCKSFTCFETAPTDSPGRAVNLRKKCSPAAPFAPCARPCSLFQRYATLSRVNTPVVNGVKCVHDLMLQARHDSPLGTKGCRSPSLERVADSMRSDVVAAREANKYPHALLALVAQAATRQLSPTQRQAKSGSPTMSIVGPRPGHRMPHSFSRSVRSSATGSLRAHRSLKLRAKIHRKRRSNEDTGGR